jgi:hypothetical protein
MVITSQGLTLSQEVHYLVYYPLQVGRGGREDGLELRHSADHSYLEKGWVQVY